LSSKLRIRIGEVEIDYEGTEEFLKQELPQLLKTAMELHKAAGSTPAGDPAEKRKPGTGGGGHTVPSLTTGSIAAKLGADSGGDLLLAAAARLVLVEKTEPFSRSALLKEMKSATAYYKKNYAPNLSSYLKRAIKDGPLTEVAKDSFSLAAAAREELEKKLADR
jgi:hypothetical protein